MATFRRLLRLLPFVLAVSLIAFAIWWASGLHFEQGPVDPRSDSISEGQCP